MPVVVLYKCKEKHVLPSQGGRKENMMAIKTNWQRRQEVAAAREYARWDWLFGYNTRRVQIRKALYIAGYKVNYPCRKK